MRATALQHSLQILDLIQANRSLTFSEIEKSVSASKATTAAILSALAAADYLSKSDRGYSLGRKILTLAASVLENYDIRQIARPCLETLCADAEETSELAIFDGMGVVFIDRCESPADVQPKACFGQRFHTIHRFAIGKVCLAFMRRDHLDHYFTATDLTPATPFTITSRGALEKQLARVRETKVAVDIKENRIDLVRVAAPVFNFEKKLAAIVGLAAPAYRSKKGKISRWKEMVYQAGKEISHRAGFNGDYSIKIT